LRVIEASFLVSTPLPFGHTGETILLLYKHS
jgi:hypothetical protein